jgi:hypothetical protein
VNTELFSRITGKDQEKCLWVSIYSFLLTYEVGYVIIKREGSEGKRQEIEYGDLKAWLVCGTVAC